MNPVHAALMQGGVENIREHEQGFLSGELPVHRVGLVRCMAATEGRSAQVQLQFMPVGLSEMAANAARTCLEVVRAQVKGTGFCSGLDIERGVIWIGAAGGLQEVTPVVRVALAIAPDLFRKLNALCTSEVLAETYVTMQAQAVSGQAVPTPTS